MIFGSEDQITVPITSVCHGIAGLKQINSTDYMIINHVLLLGLSAETTTTQQIGLGSLVGTMICSIHTREHRVDTEMEVAKVTITQIITSISFDLTHVMTGTTIYLHNLTQMALSLLLLQAQILL